MNEWLTTEQAAARSGHHLKTVQRAAVSGALHGHQPGRHGSWRFKPAAVDAWVQGVDGSTVCGCQQLALVRKRRAS